MNDDAIFRVILAAVFILLTLIRVYYARRAGRADEKTSVEGTGRFGMLLLRMLNLLAAVATLTYLIVPQRLRWSAAPLPIWLRWIGVAVGLVTVVLFLWVHRVLGENWSTSVGTKRQHALVTDGPYRWVRHPMYTTMVLWTLGFFLLSANWFVGFTWLALSLLAASRAGEEEALLVAKFGTEYQVYMQGTGRFLPGFKHREERE